jgi:hypothetical protein
MQPLRPPKHRRLGLRGSYTHYALPCALTPSPRPPQPHEYVGYDSNYEERPRPGHNELVDGPVGIVEKVSIDFWYSVAFDLIYRSLTHIWLQRPSRSNLPAEQQLPKLYPETIES